MDAIADHEPLLLASLLGRVIPALREGLAHARDTGALGGAGGSGQHAGAAAPLGAGRFWAVLRLFGRTTAAPCAVERALRVRGAGIGGDGGGDNRQGDGPDRHVHRFFNLFSNPLCHSHLQQRLLLTNYGFIMFLQLAF